MAPKKSKKSPAEAATKIQSIARRMFGRHVFANKLMASLWSDIYDTTWGAIRLNQIDKMRSAFAAEEAIEQMNRVILWATFAYAPDPLHDETPYTRPALSTKHIINSGLWEAEEQPTTTVIDRHTRFEVTAGPPHRPGSSGGGRRTTGNNTPSSRILSPSSTPGGGSRAGSRGVGGGNGGSSRMEKASSGYFDGTGNSIFGNEPAVDIRDIADPLEGRGRRGKNSISDIEREYFEQMEKDKQEKIKNEAAEAERLAEAARVKAAWDEAMKDVEGKQWTVDADGKVIVVTPVIGDKMPSRTVPVKYGVKVTDKANDTPGKGGRRGSKNNEIMNDKSPKQIQSSLSPSGSSINDKKNNQGTFGNVHGSNKIHFTESYDNQPPLIKTLQPEGGVGLIYGNQKKMGRSFNGGETRMSRSDYLEKTGFTGGTDRSLEDLDMMDKNTNGGSNNNSKTNSRIGSRKSTASNDHHSSKSDKEKFPLIDPLKGGRPLSSSSPTAVVLPGGKQPIQQRNKVSRGESTLSPTSDGEDSNNNNGNGGGGLNGSIQYNSYEEVEAAAVAAELEMLSSMNEDGGGGYRVEKFDPAPIQRRREKALQHKPQRDVRNPALDGPLPTAIRSKLAPPSSVGMSTGHGGGMGAMGTNSILSSIHSQQGKNKDGDEDNDDGFYDDQMIGMEGSQVSSPATYGGKGTQVIVPEESENQGLRYQIGINKDSNKNQFATRAV